nr:unnamed protein product [Callosobruchus analis]
MSLSLIKFGVPTFGTNFLPHPPHWHPISLSEELKLLGRFFTINITFFRSKCPKYTEETLQRAIRDVQAGASKKSVAQRYGIPRATIEFRLKHKLDKAKRGRNTYLTQEEEAKLVEWILENDRKGFPRRQIDLQLAVKAFLDNNERKNPFTNNFPGIHWYKLFMTRHPKLTERTAEGVTPASAVVSEDNIRGWFRDIEGYLKDKDLLPILADPSRIFNGDETCFQYNPKLGKVIAPKGKKNVYEVDLGKAKENLTAMFTFSASGIITPPMIIYPNKRLSSVVANEIPDEWAIGLTENGWMKSEVFIDYIKNHLHPYLRKINTKFPIILFVDGHRSHLSLELSKVCTNLEIVLIALYPNCTRIMQPADIANFRPLKSLWKRSVLQWRHKNPYCQLSKQHFAPILKTALDGLNKQYTVNGFRASGLFPWNPDALDYSKCLGKKTKIPQTSDTQMQLQCSETNCKEIVKLFDEALIKKLKGRSNQGCSTSNCENFNVLRKIYDILNSHKEKDETSIQSVFSEVEITNMPIVLLDYDETGRANHDELPNFVAHSTLSNLADEADLFSMDPQVTYSDCDIEVPNILTESELETINLSLHESGMNPNIQTETVTFSTESGYGQIGVNSPEKRLHFEESGSSACIGTFLNLPETPVRKGSR